MSIKEQLKEAVALSDTAPLHEALQDVFNSVELSEDVQSKFSTVFESMVKAKAVELAESHINEISEKADELIGAHKAELDEAAEEYGKYVTEHMETKIDTYLDHVVESWLEKNTLAVESGLKVEMFDNLVGGLKEMFVDNNIMVPDEQVNVVKELEEEVQELEGKLDAAITEGVEYKNQAKAFHKQEAIARVTEGLTESQKEKVANLAESLDFSDDFEDRLGTIVEFSTGSKFGVMTEKGYDDNMEDKKKKKMDDDKGGENYSDDKDMDDKDMDKKDKSMKESNTLMDAYLAATRTH